MTPLVLVLLWLLLGALGVFVLRGRHRWLAFLVPTAGLVATALTPASGNWPGPGAATGYGATLILGRAEWGMLLALALSCALNLLLAPRLEGGEVLSQSVVLAAGVVLLAATVPLIWGVAALVAMSAVALRWIHASGGVAALASGRIGGLGSVALLGAAAFIPVVGPPVDQRTALAGGLLAGGSAAMLGYFPLGGWAAGAVATVRGVDFGAWALLLAPPLLLADAVLLPTLQTQTRIMLEDVLLVIGLISAIWAGLLALRVPAEQRYHRILIGDIALAGAGIGSTHAEGLQGALLLLVVHLIMGPLMLNADQPGLRRPRRLGWLVLCGLPPTPLFWGRFLVLESLSLTHPQALFVGVAAAALLFYAVVRAVADPEPEPESEPEVGSGPGAAGAYHLRVLVAWILPVAAAGLGLVPALTTRQLFGIG